MSVDRRDSLPAQNIRINLRSRATGLAFLNSEMDGEGIQIPVSPDMVNRVIPEGIDCFRQCHIAAMDNCVYFLLLQLIEGGLNSGKIIMGIGKDRNFH